MIKPSQADPTTLEALGPSTPQDQIDRFLDGIDPAFRLGTPPGADQEPQSSNVALVHEVFHLIARGDFDAIAARLHEDALLEIDAPPWIPFIGSWRGREAVAAAVRRNFSMLEAQEPEVVSLSAQGDHVVLILRERGRYIAEDFPYSVRCAQVITFADGLIRRIREIVVDEPPASPA